MKKPTLLCILDGWGERAEHDHNAIAQARTPHWDRLRATYPRTTLRASELDVYGMEGIGKIYQAYKSGHLVSDDEVALIFDPFSWEPRSEPLVNIRFNLDLAWQMGVISVSCKDRLFHCAQAQYFPDRTYERMLSDAEGLVAEKELQRFREFLAREKRDFKMEDALLALVRVRKMADEID